MINNNSEIINKDRVPDINNAEIVDTWKESAHEEAAEVALDIAMAPWDGITEASEEITSNYTQELKQQGKTLLYRSLDERLRDPALINSLTSELEKHPAFSTLIDDILTRIPGKLADGVVDIQDEVVEIALAKLRERLDKIDTSKIAEAVLANDRLRGKIKVEIDDLGLGISQRLQADIKEAMTTEINLTRNLLTARREKKRAERANLAAELSDRKQEREKAWLKVQLAWMKITRASVATPLVMLGALIGAIAFANYVPAIACHKGDAICHLRVRPGVFPAK